MPALRRTDDSFQLLYICAILKNGKMAKRGRRAEEEGIGFITAYCGSCHVAWDASNTFVNADGTVEISGNGEGWEENGCND